MYTDNNQTEFDTIPICMAIEFNLRHDITHGLQERQLFVETAHTVLAKAEEAHVLIMAEWLNGTDIAKKK